MERIVNKGSVLYANMSESELLLVQDVKDELSMILGAYHDMIAAAPICAECRDEFNAVLYEIHDGVMELDMGGFKNS